MKFLTMQQTIIIAPFIDEGEKIDTITTITKWATSLAQISIYKSD